jgi:hypothetical protein
MLEQINQDVDLPLHEKLSKKERKKLKRRLKRTWKRLDITTFVRDARYACWWRRSDLEVSRRTFLEEQGCLSMSIDVNDDEKKHPTRSVLQLRLYPSRICIELFFTNDTVAREFSLDELGNKETLNDKAGIFFSEHTEEIFPTVSINQVQEESL